MSFMSKLLSDREKRRNFIRGYLSSAKSNIEGILVTDDFRRQAMSLVRVWLRQILNAHPLAS